MDEEARIRTLKNVRILCLGDEKFAEGVREIASGNQEIVTVPNNK